MQLFFNSEINNSTEHFQFSKDESRHIVKVLRKTVGHTVQITNGNGWLFDAVIEKADEKGCVVKISKALKCDARNYKLHLAVAPTKSNDRYEWFLEKATEIGITSITPIICEHSERKVIKTARFEKIMQAAMKQSQQCYLPHIHAPIPFKAFVNQDHQGLLFIAHCENIEKNSLKSQLRPQKDITVLIGPEGDFSVKEIEMALRRNFIPVTLGETRLRTETAAIVACHSVAFTNAEL